MRWSKIWQTILLSLESLWRLFHTTILPLQMILSLWISTAINISQLFQLQKSATLLLELVSLITPRINTFNCLHLTLSQLYLENMFCCALRLPKFQPLSTLTALTKLLVLLLKRSVFHSDSSYALGYYENIISRLFFPPKTVLIHLFQLRIQIT